MGKRSPRDTAPPWQIIDWETEAHKARIRAENAINPWYEKLKGEARKDFFGEQEKKDHRWWAKPPKTPGLPPEYGLPRLPHDIRQKTLRAEGAKFRERYYSGCLTGALTVKVYHDTPKKPNRDCLLDDIYVPPESENARDYSGGLTGALTTEGMRFLDQLPDEPVTVEFDEDMLGGGIWTLMKKSHMARLERTGKTKQLEANNDIQTKK